VDIAGSENCASGSFSKLTEALHISTDVTAHRTPVFGNTSCYKRASKETFVVVVVVIIGA
jgi:hypothetical protein